LFENHANELDVVFVAAPDHSHFAPSMTAVSMGIHCYTEKPLTWSVREALLLQKAYEKNKKVVTQMGNQGHAGIGWRMAYEYIRAGRRATTVRIGRIPSLTTLIGTRGLVPHQCVRTPVPVKAARGDVDLIIRLIGAVWSILAAVH
jgi:hypothetical protein